ncbi:basic salivary proline-rich protein 4-like protein [Lates japonicus]|uniref:Basic salivary proline-rich protein 4-like protein n=1 Tax=Lates japonicus TaxID=270547 RepID=A0AAD3MUF0_LATJO|nr:basic salivary proline-rich protein 4-like protein [Lates japonicus]
MAERPGTEGQNNMHVPQGPMFREEPRPPRLPVQPAAGPSWAIGAHQLPVQPGELDMPPRYPPPPPYVPVPPPGPSSYQQPPPASNWMKEETQPHAG